MAGIRPLAGEFARVVDSDRRIELPSQWTREREAQGELWLITPSFFDSAPTGAVGGVLVVMPANDLCRNHGGDGNGVRLTVEQVFQELRAFALKKGLAKEVVTTFDWSPNQPLLTLTSAQIDWLGCQDGKLMLVGLLNKAHLMTPETRRARELPPGDIARIMRASGI